jgi:hypothetical protein
LVKERDANATGLSVPSVITWDKFLPNLATEIRPLNELLEKDRKWVWNERCNRAFLKVKDMITSDVVLTHYDPNLPVRLACDAY